MSGVIIRGIGGFYTVRAEDGNLYTCKARGRFRKDKMMPMVGDRVTIAPPQGDEDGMLLEILPRKNAIVRPPVANIDQLLIVLARVPQPDLLLVDRLIISAEKLGIAPALCFNKTDLDADWAQQMCCEYAAFPVFLTSTYRDEGLAELQHFLQDRVTAFAGQSGVGKSSLLTTLLPDYDVEIGEISERAERGKHTTRRAEWLDWPEIKGSVVDTPGFSLLDLQMEPPQTLRDWYPEFQPYQADCQFAVCRHHKERGCAVKQAVEAGNIAQGRWQRYTQLVEEADAKWRNQYH